MNTDYYRLKKDGLCTNCRKPAVPGRVLCSACSEKSTKLQRRLAQERREKADAGKLCRKCLAPLEGQDRYWKTCAECRRKAREYIRAAGGRA